MKRTLLCLMICLWAFSAFAERELFPIKWSEIETTTSTNPNYVKSLVERLSLPTIDKNLTWDERRLAFYGQSILTEGKEDNKVNEAISSYNSNEYEKALELAKQALTINALSLPALRIAENSILNLIKAGNTKYQKSDAEVFCNRAFRIYNTIATTGNGSQEYPFFVTKVSDEYEFMRYYLELWEYSGQRLVGVCDVFELKETSKYFSEKKIWFDTSRSLKMFHDKMK